MRHHRPPTSAVDIPTMLEMAVPLRALTRTQRSAGIDVPAIITEELGKAYARALPIYIAELAAYIERAQRVADRFRSWRYSKSGGDEPLRKPEPIGTPFRPVRRFYDQFDVSGVVSTVL